MLAVPGRTFSPEILEDMEDGEYWNVLPMLLPSLGNHLELSIEGTHLFCRAQGELSTGGLSAPSVQVIT